MDIVQNCFYQYIDGHGQNTLRIPCIPKTNVPSCSEYLMASCCPLSKQSLITFIFKVGHKINLCNL